MHSHSWSHMVVCAVVAVAAAGCAAGESMAPDAAQGSADAQPEKPDAMPRPDAAPGAPDAMPLPDAQRLPDAGMAADAAMSPDGGPGCGTQLVTTSLDGGEPTYQRYYGTPPECILSSSGANVFYDVYKYQLTGPGPHMLTASTCGTSAFDSVITIYQAAGGAPDAFDPLDACTNRVAYNDDDLSCAGSSSIVTATGLVAGEVTVILSSFDSGTTGTYTIDISSTTCVAN